MGSDSKDNSVVASSCKEMSYSGKPCKNREETVKALESLLLSNDDYDHRQDDVYGSGPLLVSDVPKGCLDGKDGVVMGIDEAGRGPVLGPMTYAAAFWHKDHSEEDDEFNDSKVLNAMTRSKLFQRIKESSHIGFVLRVLPATELSRNMLRNPQPYNLNAMSHDAAFEMIQAVLDAGVKIQTCYIDTVGIAQSYQRKLEQHFVKHNIQFVVEKKADAKYPPCSAASVIAKVSRDTIIETPTTITIDQDYGSGYPSDPKCQAWIKNNCNDPVFAYDKIVRFSWGPAKQSMDELAIPVIWQEDENDDEDEQQQQTTMNSFFLVQPKKR